jgi:hypothetical protein
MAWQRYLLAFIITAAIFATALYLASLFDNARIADIRATEQDVSIDILSNETQYDLLSSVDCETLSQNSGLSDELNTLASQLSVAENNLGSQNAEVVQLKEQYSLLEIKDYLLLKQISQKCGIKPVYVLYFYSNSGSCAQCGAAGDVLTYLRETYPGLRIYSFDYDLDLPALRTLESLLKLRGDLPAFVINNRAPVYGFKDLQAMQKLIPELKTLATTTATTTP